MKLRVVYDPRFSAVMKTGPSTHRSIITARNENSSGHTEGARGRKRGIDDGRPQTISLNKTKRRKRATLGTERITSTAVQLYFLLPLLYSFIKKQSSGVLLLLYLFHCHALYMVIKKKEICYTKFIIIITTYFKKSNSICFLSIR